jgi:predicted amidohydrolase
MGATPTYLDPLTETVHIKFAVGVFLLAHNQQITYGYAGIQGEQPMYCEFGGGSVVIDPWRKYTTKNPDIKVIHYGNTRSQ